jgi:hypothetical protein
MAAYSGLSFTPLQGWTVVTTDLAPEVAANSQVVWTSNAAIPQEDVDSGWPNVLLSQLPADAVVLQASLALMTDTPELFVDRGLPLAIADAAFFSTGYEGQPAENVSSCLLYARVNQQYLLLIAWFGSNAPSPTAFSVCQAELDTLAVPPAPVGAFA